MHGPAGAVHRRLPTRAAAGDGARGRGSASAARPPTSGLIATRTAGHRASSDRSRRPLSCPHATPDAVVTAVLEARRHHPRWGAKKLLRILRRKAPGTAWPARSTVCDLLKRHGLVPTTRRRPPAVASGPSPHPDDGAQRHLDRRLQGAVQDPRWRVLLSPDAGRWLQPVPPGLPGPAIDRGRLGPADLPARLRGIRPATDHPHRQRRALRHDRAGPSLAVVGLVDSTRDLPRADRTRPSRTERAARAHASHLEGRGHAAALGESAPPSKSASTASAASTTTSARTKPWTRRRRPPSTGRLRARCPARWRPSNTPATSRSGSSVATAASAGNITGSASPTRSPASTSGSRRSTTASGRYTSDRSSSAGWTNGSSGSRTTRDERFGKPCHPCPRTDLLPISPAVQ